PVSGLHKTCNPCRQATAYRCNHFDGVGRQAMTITATSDNQIRKSKIRNWTIGLQTFATGFLPRSGLVQRALWNAQRSEGPALFSFNVCRANDLAPLIDTFGDKLAEISGAHRHRHATEIGKPRLDLGIGKSSIDLLVEFVDDLRGRVPRRA